MVQGLLSFPASHQIQHQFLFFRTAPPLSVVEIQLQKFDFDFVFNEGFGAGMWELSVVRRAV